MRKRAEYLFVGREYQRFLSLARWYKRLSHRSQTAAMLRQEMGAMLRQARARADANPRPK